MGSASSQGEYRNIYVEAGGKIEKISFNSLCATSDLVYMLKQVAVFDKDAEILLKTKDGGLMPITPALPPNTIHTAYTLDSWSVATPAVQRPPLHQVVTHLIHQFNRVVSCNVNIGEVQSRLTTLEKCVLSDCSKLLDIDTCQKEMVEIKGQLAKVQKLKKEASYLKRSETTKQCLSMVNPTYPKFILSPETLQCLKQPTFNSWHWEPNEMKCLLEHMYKELGLIRDFDMDPVVLRRWLHCVEQSYRNNPFHNFRHCFCVTQMMYGIIHICNMREKISSESIVIMITACICHDLDHPGYNNTYQINAKTELALRYNNQSPLENHHCAVTFQILSDPETNIFGNTDSATFRRIRSGIIMLVMATDMARHTENLNSFKSKLDTFDFKNKDHLNSLMMIMIKCCDISNEVRPLDVSEPWVDCLLEEYFNQSALEKEKGLPMAAFMDKEKVTKSSAQIGFIKFVLIPIFETFAKLLPQLCEAMVNPLKKALFRYEEMQKETTQTSD